MQQTGTRQGEKGTGVFVCLHVIFHGPTQLMLVHTERKRKGATIVSEGSWSR